jgi:hypothetical protein
MPELINHDLTEKINTGIKPSDFLGHAIKESLSEQAYL